MTTEFLLKWHNHKMDIVSVFDELLLKEALVDVTLACEDFSLKAHKIVLSACSPFFQKLFLETRCKHPIIFLKDVSYSDLKAVVEFMYKGETLVPEKQMRTFLETARSLKVIGLTTSLDEQRNENKEQRSEKKVSPLVHSGATQEKLLNNKRKSLHKVKTECVSHQLSKRLSDVAMNNEHSQDHDEPLCKRRLLKASSTLGVQKSLPILQASSSASSSSSISSPSSISVNRNMLKLAMDTKVASELTSNELQEPTPENSISDCSQQSSKTETSFIGICLDDSVCKKSEDSLPISPAAQSNASCSSLLEKNEIKETISETSHTDGKMAKNLKKLSKPQISESHNKSVADNEPTVIYENINSEGNPFICEECGRTFPHSGFLRLHKRIHSGEKPWACESCNESFTQFTHLLQHQKNVCSFVNNEQINNKGQQLSDSSPDVT